MMKRIGFFVCSGIGYLIGHYMGTGAMAAYVSILVSYHLYLGFLVMIAEKETGFSLPIGHTLVSHLACLAVVVGIAFGRHYIPFFGLVRLFVPAMAPFEVNWLFSGGKKKTGTSGAAVEFAPVAAAPVASAPAAQAPQATPIATAAPAPSFMTSTGDDYEDFLLHMKAGKRPFRKPGISVKEEFELFLAHRTKAKAAASAAAAKPESVRA
jgi:hypothetical protein